MLLDDFPKMTATAKVVQITMRIGDTLFRRRSHTSYNDDGTFTTQILWAEEPYADGPFDTVNDTMHYILEDLYRLKSASKEVLA